MEAFEHLVKVALEADGYVVTGPLKFPVKRQTGKTAYAEFQTHGYEVDLVGARKNSLVLASVKSFLGSVGVERRGFRGLAAAEAKQHFGRYVLFNEPEIRRQVVEQAAERFGYTPKQVELRLYVGKFKPSDEQVVREHLSTYHNHGWRPSGPRRGAG